MKKLRSSVFIGLGLCALSANFAGSDESKLPQLEALDLFEKELFVDAVHTRELCTEGRPFCEVPLQRRTDDFLVVVAGEQSFVSDEVVSTATETLSNAIETIQDATGLRALWSAPSEPTSNFIFITFINSDVYQSDPDGFIAARIAPASLNNPEARKAAFLEFMAGELPCMYFTSKFADGIIRDSQVWVKVEVSPSTMSMCISEELFNSMGIDDSPYFDSVFEWPNQASGSTLSGSAGSLSELHVHFLELLYAQEMQPGQSADETRRLLQIQ